MNARRRLPAARAGHQDRPRRPRPRQPHRRRRLPRRRHGGDLHAAVAEHRGGGQARARGRRRRRRHLLARHRPPDRAQADDGAARGRPRQRRASSSAASSPTTRRSCCSTRGVREVFHPGSTMDDITGRMRDYAREARRAGADADGEPDMNKPVDPQLARRHARRRTTRWQREYRGRRSATSARSRNVSGIPIQPLYTAADSRRAPAATSRSAFPASPTTRAASTRPCTAAAPGRSAS